MDSSCVSAVASDLAPLLEPLSPLDLFGPSESLSDASGAYSPSLLFDDAQATAPSIAPMTPISAAAMPEVLSPTTFDLYDDLVAKEPEPPPPPPPLPPPRSLKPAIVPTLIHVRRQSLDSLTADQRVTRRRTNNKVYAKQSRERRKYLLSHLSEQRDVLQSDIAALRVRLDYEVEREQRLLAQRHVLLAKVAALDAQAGAVPVSRRDAAGSASVPLQS